MGGNLFIFWLVCYFGPGSQKINILTAQYEQISDEQGVGYNLDLTVLQLQEEIDEKECFCFFENSASNEMIIFVML
jgi:hypothetical protein